MTKAEILAMRSYLIDAIKYYECDPSVPLHRLTELTELALRAADTESPTIDDIRRERHIRN